jgi:hypothetical protein
LHFEYEIVGNNIGNNSVLVNKVITCSLPIEISVAQGSISQPVASVNPVPNIGPDAVKYNFWGVIPSCRNSLSVALSEKDIKSPAFTVVENEPENGGVILGELLEEEQGSITICISRSTSEIRTP